MAQDDLTAGQGERIGGYRLGDVIGIGGTAEVRLAWPLATPTGAPLALKRLRPMHAGDPDAADCLRHEAQLMLDLSHPAIVRTLDAGEADGQPFLVMERLTGGSLQEVLRRHAPMHPSQVADLLTGIGDALDWLHHRGITHADIKPANILRDRMGQPKLIDFGIARAVGTAPMEPPAGFVTSAYAAPDLLLALPPDPRDDVFSLAVVIYELLTGHLPFGADPVLAIGEPDRPAALNTPAWDVLLAALSPARVDRPRHSSLLIAALRGHAAAPPLRRRA